MLEQIDLLPHPDQNQLQVGNHGILQIQNRFACKHTGTCTPMSRIRNVESCTHTSNDGTRHDTHQEAVDDGLLAERLVDGGERRLAKAAHLRLALRLCRALGTREVLHTHATRTPTHHAVKDTDIKPHIRSHMYLLKTKHAVHRRHVAVGEGKQNNKQFGYTSRLN